MFSHISIPDCLDKVIREKLVAALSQFRQAITF